MKIKDSELKAILAEVESEIGQLLKAEKDKLAKAAQDEEPADEASAESAAPPAPEASASAPATEAPATTGAAEDMPGKQPGEEQTMTPGDTMPHEESAESSEAPADPAAEAGPMDPEALKAEYAKLPPEELKMHYLAAKAALFEAMGAGTEGSAPPAPEATPAAPPAPEASAPAPAMKGEMKPSEGNGENPLKAVKKSEEDIKVKDLESQIELLTKAVELALCSPVRKAVTSVAFVPKTEAAEVDVTKLEKSEITEKLKSKAADPKLAKSDREAINGFYCGSVGIEKIAHLLK